jgi:UDP-2,4-diacetamido-2,4,6-trideoxy-beta-L-altropyranose hydrolase
LLAKEPKWISDHYPPEYYMIIADGYQFDYSYQRELKKLNYTLFYIDDLVKDQMVADVVINHSLNVNPVDYKKESYCKLALGSKYAILRPSFLEATKHSRVINKIHTAFVCFGGSDPYNLTLKATEALLKTTAITAIHVVIGAAYSHKEILAIEKSHPKVKVHQNLSEHNLIKIMKECDFAIAPSSNILYELCAVKMPILSGYYVDNQKNIYKGCLEHHVIFDGGNFEHYGIEEFEKKINHILSVKDYNKWIDAQSTLFDSKIKERFLDLVPKISYRRATSDDMMLLFDWSNEAVTRANSYFTEKIVLDSHEAWFKKKLKDQNTFIYIAEVDNKPAGMIRYELKDEQAVVGISVDAKYRGRGYASVFLIDTAKLFFKETNKPILAYIKCENSASVKSFEKADYKKIKEELVNGHNSFVYRLTKK